MFEKDRKSFHKFVEQNVSVFNNGHKKVTMVDLFRAYRSILSLKDKVMFKNVNFNGVRMKRRKWGKCIH